jgi:hypothetical protein
MASRGGIQALLYLLGEALGAPALGSAVESQAFLPNLGNIDEGVWRALPPGGARTVESIALHVGSCILMYDDYAFGSGSLDWDDPVVQPWPEGSAPMAETTAWLVAAHARLVEHVAALADDASLDALRPTNWGELRPTRWIIGAMITHLAYHAGEINHIRSILGPDDRWRFQQQGFG